VPDGQFKWGVFLDCGGALRAIAKGDTSISFEVKNLVYMLEHPRYLEIPFVEKVKIFKWYLDNG